MIATKPILFVPKPIERQPKDRPEYRPRRIPVTIAAGFICQDGILLCADTKITTDIKTNESKIEHFVSNDRQCSLTFVMSSTDLNFPRSAIKSCFEYLSETDFASATMEQVRNAVQTPLADFYREHIFPHPDRTPQAVFQQLLLGIWLRGETALFQPHETLLMPVAEYECIGSGAFLGKYLTRQFEKATRLPVTLQDAALLASCIIETCIKYDEHCGGEAEMIVIRNNGTVDAIEDSVIYPGYEFLSELQSCDWKLLHALSAQNIEDDAIVSALSEHTAQIRAAEEKQRHMLNVLRDGRR